MFSDAKIYFLDTVKKILPQDFFSYCSKKKSSSRKKEMLGARK